MVDAHGRARHRHAARCRPATSARTAASTRTTSSTSRRAGRRSRSSWRAWPGPVRRARARRSRAAGMAGVRELPARAARTPWVVGCYLHTHSWDRRLDHADYYPFYALGAERDVPVAMQAGTSGGLHAERVRPADRASTAPRSTSATRASCSRTSAGPGSTRRSRWRSSSRTSTSAPAPTRRGTGRARLSRLPARPRPHQGGLRHELPDRRAPPRARRRWRSSGLDAEIERAFLGGTAQRVFTRLVNGGHGA